MKVQMYSEFKNERQLNRALVSKPTWMFNPLLCSDPQSKAVNETIDR
jgi:hypothetical protein